jgi:polynucleotide 5'-kinase involved in rRNA processing
LTGPHTKPGYTTTASSGFFLDVPVVYIVSWRVCGDLDVLEKGFFKIRGPAKLRLTKCNVDVMGKICNGDCEFVIPTGRTYIFKVIEGVCEYSVSPREAKVERDEISKTLYNIRDEIISILGASQHEGVIFLGPPDSFKSTLSVLTFNHILSSNEPEKWKPSYVTTDVGQNEIFMPTFISGISVPVFPGIQVKETLNCFIGAISPAYNTERYSWCITRIVNKLRSRKFDLFIVDTDGWVNSYRALYSKMVIAELFENPLIVHTSLDEVHKKLLGYHYNALIEYKIPKAFITKKTPNERKIHRSRLILRAFKKPNRVIVDPYKVETVGLPIFRGYELDPSQLGLPNVVYAENQNEKIIIVVENRFPSKLRNEGVLKKNWEYGLIAALYEKGDVKGIGLVEKVDYRKRKVSLIVNHEIMFDHIEIGEASFPEVLETLKSSL